MKILQEQQPVGYRVEQALNDTKIYALIDLAKELKLDISRESNQILKALDTIQDKFSKKLNIKF